MAKNTLYLTGTNSGMAPGAPLGTLASQCGHHRGSLQRRAVGTEPVPLKELPPEGAGCRVSSVHILRARRHCLRLNNVAGMAGDCRSAEFAPGGGQTHLKRSGSLHGRSRSVFGAPKSTGDPLRYASPTLHVTRWLRPLGQRATHSYNRFAACSGHGGK